MRIILSVLVDVSGGERGHSQETKLLCRRMSNKRRRIVILDLETMTARTWMEEAMHFLFFLLVEMGVDVPGRAIVEAGHDQ